MQVIVINNCTAEEAVKVINETNLRADIVNAETIEKDEKGIETEEVKTVEEVVEEKPKKKRRARKKKAVEEAPVENTLPSPEQVAAATPAPVPAAPTPVPVTPPTPEQMFGTQAAQPATPTVDAGTLYNEVSAKILPAFSSGKLTQDMVNELVVKVNTQYGLQATGIFDFKDNVAALNFVKAELTMKGL